MDKNEFLPTTAAGFEEPAVNGVMSVCQLTRHIKQLFDADEELRDTKVRGEISNFTRASSGHLYFTLKDTESQLRCACFKNVAMGLKFKPQDGDRVVVGGAVSVYEKSGQYQLIARFMREDGAGDLAAQLEQLRARLEAEGLFDPSRKRPLPLIPRKIAVCTSPTGAAVRDICSIIERRWPLAKVIIVPTSVQGATAIPEIVHALQLADSIDDVDVIIVGRGGGSIEDLWAFNEEPVVRAVFATKHPVISAVGHETDSTLTDFVADVRAATPSMAAELAVPDRAEVEAQILGAGRHLRTAMVSRLMQERSRLERLSTHPLLSRPEALLEQRSQRLDEAVATMQAGFALRLERIQVQLERLVTGLNALSPLGVLNRGYAIIQKSDGTILRSVADAEPNDLIKALIADGEIDARILASRGININTIE